MKSYRVACVGDSRGDTQVKPYRVSITVEAWDEIEAKQKAVTYLGGIYAACDWRTTGINLITGRAPRPRRPVPKLPVKTKRGRRR